ncbi:MAG: hypothetical protein JW995_05120 [Melioribacteraceae bacterium]|nr:hypothetical protein [Melioribacteraceae bacterium]
MTEFLTLILVLFIAFLFIRMIYILFRLFVMYLNGEIKLSEDEKKDIRRSFREGLLLIVRRLYLFK